MGGGRNLLPKLVPISFFKRVSRFGGVSRKSNYGNAGNFLSRFTGAYLVFEAVTHFCFRLFRMKMPFLT